MCGTWIISKKFNTSRTVLVKYEMRKVLQLEKWKSFQPELNNLQCEMSSGFGESFCLTKCEHVLMNIRSYSRCSDQNTACLIIKQNVAYNVHTLIRIEGHDAPYAHQFEIDSYLGETFSGHCGFCLQTNFFVGFFCFDYKLARCNETRILITLYICIIYNINSQGTHVAID